MKPNRFKPLNPTVMLLLLWLCAACAPTGDEPDEVTAAVYFDGSHIKETVSDLGYTIVPEELMVCISNLEFTIEGETHASLFQQIADLIVPPALAHPGHYAGGDVTGELSGEWGLDLNAASQPYLGEATLLPGQYEGINLSFTTCSDSHMKGAPVVGFSAYLKGTATNDNTSIPFEAFIVLPDDARMVGGVFEEAVTNGWEKSLALSLHTTNPFSDTLEKGTIFDGVDFSLITTNDDGVAIIEAGSAAHNLLMKAFQKHDYWMVVPTD